MSRISWAAAKAAFAASTLPATFSKARAAVAYSWNPPRSGCDSNPNDREFPFPTGSRQWRRAREDIVIHLSAMNAETDRRRLRRPLSLEELERLLAAAHTAPPIQGVAGADRVILYIIACYTGFRRNEISSVTCRSLDLASVPPMLTVPAAYSKRRRVDIIPLRKDLAELLRVWMAGKGELRPDEPLLNIRWKRTAEMLRKDLERARAAWIDESPTAAERSARERSSFLTYQDDAGRVADFHALRKTFVTNLCLAGVSPKATQTLARHSDINLTMNTYTMLGVGDQVFIERGAGPKTQPAAKPAAAPGQFYSLDKDLAETNDLAREHAEQVKQMEQTLQQIRQSGRSRP